MSTWALETDLTLEEVNLHLAALTPAGLLGIAEAEGRATVYLDRRTDDLPIDGRWTRVEDIDWNARWRASIQPVTVGAITIAPPWLGDPDPHTIVIEPGQAFGTGHHETTTGCLAALQELDLAGRRVLDAGTGTGVLAIAAALLGAADVLAVDVDPVAVVTARENVRGNRVDVTVRRGSVSDAGKGFDVVVANLDTATIITLGPALAAALRPGGVLIASGVSVERQGEAVTALEAAGVPVSVRQGREWVVLTGRSPGVQSPPGVEN